MKNNRRKFLKNTALTTLAIGSTPILSNANSLIKNKNTDFSKNCSELTEDYYGEGPYYNENAPFINDGIIAPIDELGTRLIISGVIKNLDCTKVIPNTELDIWQANNAGEYDLENYHLRKKIKSNNAGFYSFETILPGKYLVGVDTYRPRHIHLKITAPGYPVITTQLYFEGDSSIDDDPAASISSGDFDASNRIISLTDNNGVLEGTWNIVIDGNGVLNINDLHLTKGIIYNISPNPFSDELNIHYGVFKSSKVKIEIYNLQGQLVESLNEKQLDAEKYTINWKPKTHMDFGVYFCVLKINDLQVHYKKNIKR